MYIVGAVLRDRSDPLLEVEVEVEVEELSYCRGQSRHGLGWDPILEERVLFVGYCEKKRPILDGK